MVIKKPRKELTKTTPTQSVDSTKGGTLQTSTPQTGSPTTADSGLISAKRTRPNSKTPRQIATGTVAAPEPNKPMTRNKTTKSGTSELKISDKRRLAFNLLRGVQKSETVLEKVLKYFVNNNFLKDPVKQNLNYGVHINVKPQLNIYAINFDCDNRTANMYDNLKKEIKDIEVTPYDQQQQDNHVGIYIKSKKQ